MATATMTAGRGGAIRLGFGTAELVRGIFGTVADPDAWQGPLALLCVPVVPVLAIGDAALWLAAAVMAAVRRLRVRGAALLRRAADGLDGGEGRPVVVVAVEHPQPALPDRLMEWGNVADPWADPRWDEERWTVAPETPPAPPAVLPMPSANQVTLAEEAAPVIAWSCPAVAVDLAELLARHGSIRAAAKAIGVAESTLRVRCRKAGVKAPRPRKAVAA